MVLIKFGTGTRLCELTELAAVAVSVPKDGAVGVE
jgi:hypothetical protein